MAPEVIGTENLTDFCNKFQGLTEEAKGKAQNDNKLSLTEIVGLGDNAIEIYMEVDTEEERQRLKDEIADLSQEEMAELFPLLLDSVWDIVDTVKALKG